VDGYLQLDVESGSVAGNVTFQDLTGTLFLAGTNTIAEGTTEAYISQVATGFSGYYTGVACVNISGMPTLVNVLVYDAGGRLIAQGVRALLTGQRFSELLSQLTGFFGQLQGGYIRILSSLPVVSFGVVGTDRTLASVPAQIPGQ
jgi:hypothetical protein